MNAPSAVSEKSLPNHQASATQQTEAKQQNATPPQTANSTPINDSSRCQHRFANRTRCRHQVSPANPRFCPRHAALPENMQPADLTPKLIKDPADLDGLDGIYDFLAKLIVMHAQNRVSTRRAAVLAYITNQLLRTFAAIQRIHASKPTQIIFDAPRPIRD